MCGTQGPAYLSCGVSKVDENRLATFVSFVVCFLEVDGFVEGGVLGLGSRYETSTGSWGGGRCGEIRRG